MTSHSRPGLLIESDLRLVVDGCQATIEATGHNITVRTDDVGGLLALVLDSSATIPGGAVPLLERLGDSLDAAGLVARVVGPGGLVIAIGEGCGSRLGRVLLGNGRVSFGAAPVLARAAAGYLTASGSGRLTTRRACAIVVVALGVALASRSRRLKTAV